MNQKVPKSMQTVLYVLLFMAALFPATGMAQDQHPLDAKFFKGGIVLRGGRIGCIADGGDQNWDRFQQYRRYGISQKAKADSLTGVVKLKDDTIKGLRYENGNLRQQLAERPVTYDNTPNFTNKGVSDGCSNPNRDDLYFNYTPTAEGGFSIQTNMSDCELQPIAAQLCCLKPAAPVAKEEGKVKKVKKSDDNDDALFEPAFEVNVLPTSEAAIASGGVQFNMTERLAFNGGAAFGYRRIPQTTSVNAQSVEIETGTHTFVGAKVGASYKVTDRILGFASATIWGTDSDDNMLTVGAAYRVKRNVYLGISANLGSEMKGLGLNLQF